MSFLEEGDQHLLDTYPIRLVGSVLTSQTPTDVDLVMVVPDGVFQFLFGDPIQWMTEGELGVWSEVRYKWFNCCMRISREFWDRFGRDNQKIDFKIHPQSLVEMLSKKKR